MSKKHPTAPPEEKASLLLSELSARIREGHELLSDYRQLLRELREERLKVEDIVTGLRAGDIPKFVDEAFRLEVGRYAEALQQATAKASEEIRDQISRMTGALMGVPPEILKNGVRLTASLDDILAVSGKAVPTDLKLRGDDLK